MKSPLRKLRGFGFHKHDRSKDRRQQPAPTAPHDELLQASQDMLDMRNCYDSLLSAAAATTNCAYEFSEALQELGTSLLEKTSLDDDEETGRVLLMLGKAQFELQKLVDHYRVHIIQTITTPSQSLLKELQIVEDMKRQCDDKRDLYKFMVAAQREKGKGKHTKAEDFSEQQLQAAQEDYQEEATLFLFRLKSLKQGQSRSLLIQAARHHAAQLNFFRRGVKSLEAVEPHVRLVAETKRIDYQFTGLGDDEIEDDDDDEGGDNDDEGESDGDLSFDYEDHVRGQDFGPTARNSMEAYQPDHRLPSIKIAKENDGRHQADFLPSNDKISMSAPLFPYKKSEPSERQLHPLSSKKFHSYVLPTPGDVKTSPLIGSATSISASHLGNKSGHSSPMSLDMLGKDIKNFEMTSSTGVAKTHSVLKESNTYTGPIRSPSPFGQGASLSQFMPARDSDSIKPRAQAFSGPLTSGKPLSSKPGFSVTNSLSSVEYAPVASTKPTQFHTSQPLMGQKVAKSVSPLTSPRINELHELPRPPLGSVYSSRVPSLIAHSAPLTSRGQEAHSRTKSPSKSSKSSKFMASPLPMPPSGVARSYSIPSRGQRVSTVTVVELVESPKSQTNNDISSPTLRPISLTRSRLASNLQ